MTSRPRCSPAAPPLDSDDLLPEILLHLPPHPSSLPRASAVCKRWRLLVSNPRFVRRFHLHHRRNPPLVGFFHDGFGGLSFVRTLEPPNRVPADRFVPQIDHDGGDRFWFLGCRHGLVLIFHASRRFHKQLSPHALRRQVLVWDPVTGDQHSIAIPAEFDKEITRINGAVLRDARDAQHFQVVLVVAGIDDQRHTRALACVYSSDTGGWGDLISAPLSLMTIPLRVFTCKPATLVRNCFYWVLNGIHNPGVLQFDLERKSLAVIQGPVDIFKRVDCEFWVMRTEGGGLGYLAVSESNFSVQLWKRKTDSDDVASWGLGRTFQMDKLLPLNSEQRGRLNMLGFGENTNVVFLWTSIGVFMVSLETLQFKKLFKTKFVTVYHPFESVYATGTSISGGHGATALLPDTDDDCSDRYAIMKY